ncbi:hypothetical protein N7485_000850 [Penicillium canescens]|nr:hypothetical protein N7485_000850 [Penicillium canescens]
MAAMQANPGMRPVNMGMHMQQQMPHGQPQNLQQQQFFAIQQAQQPNNGQPGQHTPQRASAQPPNMHEAQSATPQSQHGPPPGSGTPQPSQPAQTPSNQPQPSQGLPQGQATPNPPPQQLPQAQQPNQQGQPGPQSTPQGAQPQPGQPGQPQGPQHPQMMSQDAQLKAQQHQNALMMQQRMKQTGQSILTLYSYAEVLSNFQSRGEAHDLSYWQAFVERFYSPGGVLRQGVWNNTAGSKQFEIATPALARYYLTQFTSGITQIQMCVEAARERESGNGGHIVESGKTSFVYWFKNECQLFANGTLRAYFDVNNRLEMLDINVLNHNEFIPRSLLLAMEADSQKQSPKVPKNAKRAQQKPTPSLSLPDSMVTANGVPTPVMGFLEVAETISQMQMLFQFSQSNPQLTPPDALRNLVNTLQTQNPNPGFAPGPMNPGMQPMQNVRGPNMNAPSQFASPAMAHLGLPGQQGSPHLTGSAHPSPAQSNLTGPPGMQPPMQPSPAGVNNSPNVGGNKRRRASTVKMESEDGGGVEANGALQQGSAKVKASPRVPKRQRAPPPDYVEILLLLLGFFFIPISGDVELAYDWIPGQNISPTLVCLFLFRIFHRLDRSICVFGT